MRRLITTLLLAAAIILFESARAAEPATVRDVSGVLADGALWRARIPINWNGTLLLYSHGYAPQVQTPALAPRGVEALLLEHGYALTASSYSHGGWAVAEAVPDQLATLQAFVAAVGRPVRTIAWGESMGGLITIALAERAPPPVDAALTACGSIGGSLAMMNLALDGAFAFRTLLAPDSMIRLVAVDDDRANGARVAEVLDAAMTTAAGRARVALAGALAGIPGWTQPDSPRPDDDQSQLEALARSFVAGVFLPRTDQEQRAGGVFSWNTGIDYRAQLARSGRRAWVQGFYRRAGLSLDRDLATLNAAPRVVADANAVAYMRANYAPSGVPRVPVLSYHTIGDGLTSPSMQAAYAQAVQRTGQEGAFRALWLQAPGHCTFSPAEHLTALQTLEQRMRGAAWQTDPAQLNARAAALQQGPTRFIAYTPPAFTRPCLRRNRRCSGEPAR